MRHVQASEAKTHLPSLLDDVERGETLVITRHGKPIARIVPEEAAEKSRIRQAIDELVKLRKSMPRLSIEDILSAKHEGHKY